MNVSIRTLLSLYAPSYHLLQDVFARVLGEAFYDEHYTLSEADIAALEGEFYRLMGIHTCKRLCHFTVADDVLDYAQSNPELRNDFSLLLRRQESDELTAAMGILCDFVGLVGHMPSVTLLDSVYMGGSMQAIIERTGNRRLDIPVLVVLGATIRDADYRLTQADVEDIGRQIVKMQVDHMHEQPSEHMHLLDALGLERESDEAFLAHWPAYRKTSQESMDMVVDDFLHIVSKLGLKPPAAWQGGGE